MLLDADDDLLDDDILRVVACRQRHSLDDVVPDFDDDLPSIGDDDWEIVSGDARRLLMLYLDEENWRWRLTVVDR